MKYIGWDFLPKNDEKQVLEAAIKERDEARALATWFFQECVAPYGFDKERVRMLRKKFPWLKGSLQAPAWNSLLQEVCKD